MGNKTGLVVIALWLALPWGRAFSREEPKPNVLLIMVDDLRPELKCFGASQAKTPHIDRLAASGTVFRRAYVSVAVCAPSREAMLTGLRPASNGCFNIPDGPAWERDPGHVALPMLFKNNGYTTSGYGKVAHSRSYTDPRIWTRYDSVWRPRYANPETQAAADRSRAEAEKKGLKDEALWESLDRPSYENEKVEDEAYGDGEMARLAVDELQAFSKSGEPFFLAVGFRKPHLPFNAPARYWDLYDRETVELSPAPTFGKYMPHRDEQGGAHGEMLQYADQRMVIQQLRAAGETQYPKEFARALRHGYLACVSYVDALVGHLLQTLEETGLDKNTIVVLVGDHGWHLGDLGIWGKHSTFEFATRAPLIVRVPGQKRTGTQTDALVELLDIYPSLAEACGLSMPENLEGKSFLSLLDDPSKDWKSGVLSEYIGKSINGTRAHSQSLRTVRYRYTEHRDAEHPTKLLAVELFDHETDPYETMNVASKHPALVDNLALRLKDLKK